MKKMITIILLSFTVFSTLAYASTNTTNPASQSQLTQTDSQNQESLNNDTNHRLTREEVYQQLVKAEKDGSLKRLNDTIYKGN